MNDKLLDDIYFSLPIMYGDGVKKAATIGISYPTLIKGLWQLVGEGLAVHPRCGYWVENLDE